MKLLLSVENHPILSGYKILSPLNGFNILNPSDIDDGECEEIICDNVLNYCPIEHLYNYIAVIARKLEHSGKLIIISDDALSVSSAYSNGIIDTLQYNKITFGLKNHAWDFKQSNCTLDEIIEIVNQLSLKILTKKIHNLKFSITCQRN